MRRVFRWILDKPLALFARVLLNRTQVFRRLDALGGSLQTLAGQQLREKYPNLASEGPYRLEINRQEARVSSMAGEDGMLLYLFSKIGVTNRVFVEFGVEDGTECNAANLAINFGWRGLLMDGDEGNVVRGRDFYQAMLGGRAGDIVFIPSWVTAKNINETIRQAGFEGEIDLLSIDIDGNDYWVWKTLDVVDPRVVAIEYNAAYGTDRCTTIPYDPKFNRWKKHPSGFYFGASLAALTKLAHIKGYLLAGCCSAGTNAFFVRRDAAAGRIEEVGVREAYFDQFTRVVRGLDAQAQFHLIEHLPFEEV